ncbi:MAG: biotin/lipoyl-containing protein [Elusimicrobiota bacterium]
MRPPTPSTPIKSVMDWLRSTDLAEVSYRRGGDGIHLRLDEGAGVPEPSFPPCPLVAVTSPEVGVFRSSALGKPPAAERGRDVKEGQTLGLVETGDSEHKIAAPVSGRIVSAHIEEGSAVEYGQPLFFIRPR